MKMVFRCTVCGATTESGVKDLTLWFSRRWRKYLCVVCWTWTARCILVKEQYTFPDGNTFNNGKWGVAPPTE